MHICEDAVKRLKTVGITTQPLCTSRNVGVKHQIVHLSSLLKLLHLLWQLSPSSINVLFFLVSHCFILHSLFFPVFLEVKVGLHPCRPLSNPPSFSSYARSWPEQQGRRVHPAPVGPDRVVPKKKQKKKKEANSGIGSQRRGRGKQFLLHVVSCLPELHPGHKLMTVDQADPLESGPNLSLQVGWSALSVCMIQFYPDSFTD